MKTIIALSVALFSTSSLASVDFGTLIVKQIQDQQETHQKLSQELDLLNTEAAREKVTVTLPNVPVVSTTTMALNSLKHETDVNVRVEQKEFSLLNEELKTVE